MPGSNGIGPAGAAAEFLLRARGNVREAERGSRNRLRQYALGLRAAMGLDGGVPVAWLDEIKRMRARYRHVWLFETLTLRTVTKINLLSLGFSDILAV